MSLADKKSLRRIYFEKRRVLSSGEVREKSGQITNNLLKLEEVNDKSVACYLPINNEVDTSMLVDQLLRQGAKVFVPCWSKKSEGWAFGKFVDWESLSEGPFGTMQPKTVKGEKVEFKVAIVPGIAFSLDGVRLGYGKGVFDRLLSGRQCLKIGLAYNFQIVDELPQDKHDLVMDVIVTEKRVIRL